MRSNVLSPRILLRILMRRWTVRTMRTAAEWITLTAVSVWPLFFSPYDLQNSTPRSSQTVRYNEVARTVGHPGNRILDADYLTLHPSQREPRSHPFWTVFLYV